MRSSIPCRVALLLCGLAPSTSWSAGAHNFEFLRVGIAPQPAAMGGAFVALSEGTAALDGNVAGLSLIPDSEAMAAYMRYPQDVQAGWVAVGRFVPSGWRLGFGLKYLSYGSMTRTTVADPAGQHSDSFSASDVAIKFGAAYGVADRLRAGVAATYVSGTIDSYKAGGAGLDLGILFDLPIESLRLGASLRNLQVSGSSYLKERISLPTEGRIGIGWALPARAARVTLEVALASGTGAQLAGGAEVRVGNALWFRAGVDGSHWNLGKQADGWGTLSAVGWGLGILVDEWAMDYSVCPFGSFGTIHRLSVRSTIQR